MIYVDSSALMALLDSDDENHQRAVTIWREEIARGEVVVTSNYIVVEMLALLQRRGGMAVVRRFVEDILPMLSIEWVQAPTHSAAITSLLLSSRTGPNIVDCASFTIMHQLGISRVFTYDRHFTDLGFTVLS